MKDFVEEKSKRKEPNSRLVIYVPSNWEDNPELLEFGIYGGYENPVVYVGEKKNDDENV